MDTWRRQCGKDERNVGASKKRAHGFVEEKYLERRFGKAPKLANVCPQKLGSSRLAGFWNQGEASQVSLIQWMEDILVKVMAMICWNQIS